MNYPGIVYCLEKVKEKGITHLRRVSDNTNICVVEEIKRISDACFSRSHGWTNTPDATTMLRDYGNGHVISHCWSPISQHRDGSYYPIYNEKY